MLFKLHKVLHAFFYLKNIDRAFSVIEQKEKYNNTTC